LLVSCTQKRREGSKTTRGEAPRHKHNPKPKPQECITTMKKVCSLEEENNEKECHDNCCHSHLLHIRKERRSKTTRGSTRE
jgi:hypothetical protein